MSKHGPVIIIEDEADEVFLYKAVLRKIKIRNKILFFKNGREAYDYLLDATDSPFLIICDMRMPDMDGLELRQRIHDNPGLRKKATPFVFRTSTANHKDLLKAYDLTVQGFFEKSHDYDSMLRQIRIIFDYWHESLEPNNHV